MFLCTLDGHILFNGIYPQEYLTGDLWVDNTQMGKLKNGLFFPQEHYVLPLNYWYSYTGEYAIVYYTKITINDLPKIFPGRYPPLLRPGDNGGIRAGILQDSLPTHGLTRNYILFMLNLYTLSDHFEIPENPELTSLFQNLVTLYLLKLDQMIESKEYNFNSVCMLTDIFSRMLLTHNYTALYNYINSQSDLIFKLIIFYGAEVISTIPVDFCQRILTIHRKNRYIRMQLTFVARKYNRIDLMNPVIPSPLKKSSLGL